VGGGVTQRTCRRRHHKEENHGLPQRSKIVDLIQSARQLHIAKEWHPKYGEDEHDEEEEEEDVEEGREWHGQCEEESPNPFGPFDEAEDASHLGHPHDSEQSRRHKIFLNKVSQGQGDDGDDDHNKIK